MAAKSLFLTNRHFQDLNPLVAGTEKCYSKKQFGPWVRNYTLIHYVLKGKGVFRARGEDHPVCEGQAFLILPDEVTTYIADAQDPWHYCWMGFDGRLTEAFRQLPPVFELPEAMFDTVLHSGQNDGMLECRLAADLFRLYAWLFRNVQSENQHVRRVENYIRSYYMQDIRVEELASTMGLNRRYLSRLFKEKNGRSIQQYLVDVRMEAARQHLQRGCSVKEAADLCGYVDVSNFSKMFKARTGKSPAAYRK